jgi:hypothetical protein
MFNGFPGGNWYSFNDVLDGGTSTITPGNDPQEFLNNIILNGALVVNFNLGTGFEYPYAAIVFDWISTEIGSPKLPANLSDKTGLCITYQGSRVSLNMTQANQIGFDSYTTILPATASIETVEIPFNHFTQEGWGEAFPQDLSVQESLQFQFRGTAGTAGTTGSTTLYQVGFTGECNLDIPSPVLPLSSSTPVNSSSSSQAQISLLTTEDEAVFPMGISNLRVFIQQYISLGKLTATLQCSGSSSSTYLIFNSGPVSDTLLVGYATSIVNFSTDWVGTVQANEPGSCYMMW